MVSLVFHMFAMGRASHLFIYFFERGWGEEGSSQKKNKIMHKKRRRKNGYTRKHGKTFMQVSPIFGICVTGMLERKINSHIFNPIGMKSVE